VKFTGGRLNEPVLWIQSLRLMALLFSATVPADKPFLFVLVNENGVAVRSPISPKRPRGRGYSLTHTFNGHDYLRPNDVIHCTGCHKGHMLRPELAMEAKTNLARLGTASSSSEQHPFDFGAWRINDLTASHTRK